MLRTLLDHLLINKNYKGTFQMKKWLWVCKLLKLSKSFPFLSASNPCFYEPYTFWYLASPPPPPPLPACSPWSAPRPWTLGQDPQYIHRLLVVPRPKEVLQSLDIWTNYPGQLLPLLLLNHPDFLSQLPSKIIKLPRTLSMSKCCNSSSFSTNRNGQLLK